jgi:hypothetical protein
VPGRSRRSLENMLSWPSRQRSASTWVLVLSGYRVDIVVSSRQELLEALGRCGGSDFFAASGLLVV